MSHKNTTRNHRPLWRIFAAPIWIALASLIGLASALMGEGIWNLLSWVGLGVPALVTAYTLHYRAR